MAHRLLVIVPTRGRPQAVAGMVDAWTATGVGPEAALLFGVDADDPALGGYQAAVKTLFAEALRDRQRLPFELRLQVGPRKRMIGTLNELATQHAPQFYAVGFMGDDHRPRSHGWAARYLECLSGGTGIVYGNDLIQGPAMATEVALTADIITALGYMAPPELTHLCADVVWCEWGRAIGRITYLNDVIIEHVHPVAGTGVWDDGYAAVNNPDVYAHDGAAYADYKNSGRFDRDVTLLRKLL